jgi:hypothetical protein
MALISAGIVAGCDQARDPSTYASYEQAKKMDRESGSRIALAWGEASKEVGKVTFRNSATELDQARLKIVTLYDRVKDIPPKGDFDTLRLEGLKLEIERLDAAKKVQAARKAVEEVGRRVLNDPGADFEVIQFSQEEVARSTPANKKLLADALAAQRAYDQAANKLQEVLLRILDLPISGGETTVSPGGSAPGGAVPSPGMPPSNPRSLSADPGGAPPGPNG